MWLKSSIFDVMENTCFDPFLPGHPNWIATKAYIHQASECIHTAAIYVYASLKHMKGGAVKMIHFIYS